MTGGLFTAPTAPAAPATFSTAPVAPTGRTYRVGPGTTLQAAIDSAAYGDVIMLQAGVTHRTTNGIVLRGKSGTGWITIRTSTPDSLLPSGVRVTPADAPKLARLVGGLRNAPILRADPGAHHYRVVGLDLAVDSTVTAVSTLVAFGGTNTDPVLVPRWLVLDRTWVRANANTVVNRCVALNAAYAAVVDSRLSDCHNRNTDAQAIGGSHGPGPFKIENNYLEGSTEVIMFGGSDPKIPDLVPSDITIRGNHITRPTSWKGVWLVKNLLELKNARRVAIEGNVLENNWADGQTGYAFNLKSVNQSGGCRWCVVSDVDVRYNVVRNSPAGVTLTAADRGAAATPASRIRVQHNVFLLRDGGAVAGARQSWVSNWMPQDVSFRNNLVDDDATAVLALGGTAADRLEVVNNVATAGSYGIRGDGAGSGATALARYAPNARVEGNVFVGGALANTASGNWWPATFAEVGLSAGFISPLSASSPYVRRGTDGRDPGPDMVQLLARTAAAVTGRVAAAAATP